jgi:hypothetical protein
MSTLIGLAAWVADCDRWLDADRPGFDRKIKSTADAILLRLTIK